MTKEESYKRRLKDKIERLEIKLKRMEENEKKLLEYLENLSMQSNNYPIASTVERIVEFIENNYEQK